MTELETLKWLRELRRDYRRGVDLGYKRLRVIEALIEELIVKEKEKLNDD